MFAFIRPNFLLTAVLAATLTLGGCALPPPDSRVDSQVLSRAQSTDTRLGHAVQARLDDHPDGVSGIYPLENSLDAFTARAMLAEGADKTLDVQYYIWADDTTGRLLLKTLREAADRGVRVRLLLDDNGIAGLDTSLAALHAHDNIEVRLFNPFPVRRPKWIGYLWEFPRLNHRMHNKSFTADSQASIIGGRNVADEYFGANQQSQFADLDVLALGPAARQVGEDFDRYWASASAYPVDQLLPVVDAPQAVLDETLEPPDKATDAQRYVEALEQSSFLQRLLDETLEMTWAKVSVISDDPKKALGKSPDERLVSRQLSKALAQPRSSVTLVSPYFVPTDSGVALFGELEAQGVEVTVLTNSLAANDVALVHAGYANYRKLLLRGGVKVYEMQRTASKDSKRHRSGVMGSSASSLHAKTFAIDGEVLFIGSFNFDPRSTHLNTEIGFLIESPALATAMEESFAEDVPQSAYELGLDNDDLLWVERHDGKQIRHDHEPETGPFKRFWVSFLSFFPLESLL
ncbi:MAG: phospholipase D family protein [Halomonas subglaciescola]|nr:phospholipase D family protein [Halomonas subglaciescola]